MRNFITRITRLWHRQRLTSQFLVASIAVFTSGMVIVGAWTSDRIETGVTDNTAAATALYFESFVAPVVQDLATSDNLPVQKRYLLDKLIADTPISQRVVSFKIWRQGEVIAYATQSELIGKTFPSTPKLRAAWSGRIAAGLDDLDQEENKPERATGEPLLEIYVPIREENSGRIIAVAEFYERAAQLEHDIFNAKLEGWLIIASIAVCAIFAFWGIVIGASRTIDRQKGELENRFVSSVGCCRKTRNFARASSAPHSAPLRSTKGTCEGSVQNCMMGRRNSSALPCCVSIHWRKGRSDAAATMPKSLAVRRPFSLRTGNITGNFPESWVLPLQRLQVVAATRRFVRKFPAQRNSELIRVNREFLAEEQGISPVKRLLIT